MITMNSIQSQNKSSHNSTQAYGNPKHVGHWYSSSTGSPSSSDGLAQNLYLTEELTEVAALASNGEGLGNVVLPLTISLITLRSRVYIPLAVRSFHSSDEHHEDHCTYHTPVSSHSFPNTVYLKGIHLT